MSQQVREYPTLYMVRQPQDGIFVLVVAPTGTDAIRLCVEDGFDWAQKACQVVRIHKNIDQECGVVDAFTVAGGRGNAKNRARQFIDGQQAETNKTAI